MSDTRGSAARVAFLHVPKCGGVSVESQLRKHFTAPDVAPFYFPHEYENVTDPAKLQPYNLVIGHFDHDVLELLGPGFVKATLIREPLARAISLYNHAASRPRHALHQSISSGDMTFVTFCSGKMTGVRNTLAKYLLGRRNFARIAGRRASPDALRNAVDLAMEHLDHFDCVGMLYDMERFHRLLAKKTGLKLDPFNKINSSPQRISIETITAEELSAFEAANGFDIQIYQAIRTHFERRGQEQNGV